ncbi:MAG: energy-coupling factor ABC transporter permease [Pseudomonadota bacterium]
MPVALISTSTSPARGPSRSTSAMDRGSPAFQAMAALVFIFSSVSIRFPDGAHAAGHALLVTMLCQLFRSETGVPCFAVKLPRRRRLMRPEKQTSASLDHSQCKRRATPGAMAGILLGLEWGLGPH